MCYVHVDEELVRNAVCWKQLDGRTEILQNTIPQQLNFSFLAIGNAYSSVTSVDHFNGFKQVK